MMNCSDCRYFKEIGEACEFAAYKDLVSEEKSDAEVPCHDAVYLDFLLKREGKKGISVLAS